VEKYGTAALSRLSARICGAKLENVDEEKEEEEKTKENVK
jgi:hypothetical protein